MKTALRILMVVWIGALLYRAWESLPFKTDNFSQPVTTPGWGKK